MENLSRGMQQKVALARALLTSPVLLLLDEPTTGLDPRSKQEVQTFIREIREAARLDDPALHARHEGGGGARRPDRPARPRRAAVPRAGGGRDSTATASTRSKRRSSPRPAGPTRTSRPKTTRRGRCSRDGQCRHDVHAPQDPARRADRPLRRRRAQPVPDQALFPLGSRVPALDGREHADDRVHLARRRPRRRPSGTSSRRSCSSAASSGRSSGSSSRSSPRRSRGSGGKGRSSTRSWRRSRGRCT